MKRKHISAVIAGLLIFGVLGFRPDSVAALTAGPRSGGTFADDSSNSGSCSGGGAWTSTSNAAASNDSYANCNTVGTFANSRYLKATNFGFSIPAGATINGIQTSWETRGGTVGNSGRTWIVRLVKGGTIQTSSNKSFTYHNSESIDTVGGVADLWSIAWTAADINDSGFGTAAYLNNNNGSSVANLEVDHITMTVTYTEAVAGTSRQQRVIIISGRPEASIAFPSFRSEKVLTPTALAADVTK